VKKEGSLTTEKRKRRERDKPEFGGNRFCHGLIRVKARDGELKNAELFHGTVKREDRIGAGAAQLRTTGPKFSLG
jgi:hypothetical protein